MLVCFIDTQMMQIIRIVDERIHRVRAQHVRRFNKFRNCDRIAVQRVPEQSQGAEVHNLCPHI